MIDLQRVQATALRKGACEKIADIRTVPELMELFYSPQGVEFAEKAHFPDIGMLRRYKFELERYGVYVDCGPIEIKGRRYLCLAGNTKAVVRASGSRFTYNIIVMHGACVEVAASDYAVIKVTDVAAGEIRVTKDATVVAV